VSVPREGTNDAASFLLCITELLEEKVLVEGDILVLDNARIHNARRIRRTLRLLLACFGVRLLFLPCYRSEIRSWWRRW
jgi:transposase